MPGLLLPAHTQLHSAQPQPLVWKDGAMVPAAPLLFPDFFVNTEQVAPYLNPSSSAPIHIPHNFGSGRLPVAVTDKGLFFDTAWAPFSVFERSGNDPDWRIVREIAKGNIAWDLKCPVMAHYESILGHLIFQYGKSVGGNPDRPGMNASQTQYDNPLAKLVQGVSSSRLSAFEDRSRTLLDMATEQQQWHLAEFLWDKGVRWSASYLETGRPLEALVVATLALQGILPSRPLDIFTTAPDGPERVEWLQTWLDRYNQAGGALTPSPTLDYRARLAKIRGWSQGTGMRDTPASFWISRFVEPLGGAAGLPACDRVQPHVRDLVQTWVNFWAHARVEIVEETPTPSGALTLPGFLHFWKSNKQYEGWVEFVQTAWRRSRLEMEAVTSTSEPPRATTRPRAF